MVSVNVILASFRTKPTMVAKNTLPQTGVVWDKIVETVKRPQVPLALTVSFQMGSAAAISFLGGSAFGLVLRSSSN